MAVAVKPSKSLLNIRSGIKSIKDSFSGLRKNAGNLNDVVLKKTKVKRESIVRNAILSQRRQEQERRKNKEDLLEASTIGGAVKRQAKAVASSTKGFLGRIMDFLATLLVGWLLTNLPSIITMAQELIARIQRLYTIVTGFFDNTIKMFRGFGNLLGAVSKNILTFDFTDSKGRVESSLKDLGGTFEDMQKQFDEGFKLLTTSLGEGVVSGEDAAPFGTRYENESMQQQPSGGGGGDSSGLFELIAGGEGGYESINRGSADDSQGGAKKYLGKNLQDMTISEIMSLQSKGKVSAVGKYQIVTGTMPGFVKWLQSKGYDPKNTKYSAKIQDLYPQYTIESKRPQVGKFLSGSMNDIQKANLELAAEFASVGVPFDMKAGSYGGGWPKYDIKKGESLYSGRGRNRASITPEQVQNALKQAKSSGGNISSAQTTPTPTPPPIQSGKRFKVGDVPTIGRGVNNILITDLYGSGGGTHKGLDIAAPLGTYIALRYDCEVVATGTYGRYGLLIDVWVPQLKVQLRMSHLSAVLIKSGRIKAGTSFARVGQSGRATGPHIHFEYDTVKGRSDYGGSGDPSAYVSVLLLTSSPNQGSFSPAPAQIAAPTPAQITSSGTQQRQQASQQLAQQQVGPSIIIIEEEPPAPQQQGSIGGGGAMMIPIIINPLNSFITKKLLLDLAYT